MGTILLSGRRSPRAFISQSIQGAGCGGDLDPGPEVEIGWSQSCGPRGLNEVMLAINLPGSSLKLLPVNCNHGRS